MPPGEPIPGAGPQSQEQIKLKQNPGELLTSGFRLATEADKLSGKEKADKFEEALSNLVRAKIGSEDKGQQDVAKAGIKIIIERLFGSSDYDSMEFKCALLIDKNSPESLETAAGILNYAIGRNFTTEQVEHLDLLKMVVETQKQMLETPTTPRSTKSDKISESRTPSTNSINVTAEKIKEGQALLGEAEGLEPREKGDKQYKALENFIHAKLSANTPEEQKDTEEAIDKALSILDGGQHCYQLIESASYNLEYHTPFYDELARSELRLARTKKPTQEETRKLDTLKNKLKPRQKISTDPEKQTYEVRDRTYTVEKRLGGGKYCEVFKAVSNDGEEVAIKVANKNLTLKEQWDFEKEEYSLLELDKYQQDNNLYIDGKPLTPKNHGYGQTAEGQKFIVMTLAKGTNLGEILRDRPSLDERDKIIIGEQFCRVLESLHGCGYSYYDFQAINIFWDKQAKRIIVVDFNMLAPLTLANGERIEFNPREDLFRFGKVLFKLFTGSYEPFDTYKDTVNYEHLSQILDKSHLNDRIKGILTKSLNSDPTQRYSTAKELRNDLVEFLKPPNS